MIIGVCVKFVSALEIRLPKPNRHSDCFSLAIEQYGVKPDECVGSENQGFYTDTGKYLNRIQAMEHVRNCGQDLLPDKDGYINKSDFLFSKDVWFD